MRVCSFDLKCRNFTIDFAPIKNQELYTLYKNSNNLESFFPVGAKEYYLKIYLEHDKYIKKISLIQHDAIFFYLWTIAIIFVLSILFSIYALYPLRSALLLTQEFIKDILHDFNTPLSALRLNSYMLKREIGENEKILRLEQAIHNILSLQENLKSYLFNYEQKKESVDIEKLVRERISLIKTNYDDITFEVDVKNLNIEINRSAFTRIFDNILSNAAKYNKKNGKISVIYDKKSKILSIVDTGKGIKNPSKIFNRFYKEQERGIGIGLHIVKKLCDELKIGLEVSSKLDKGTTFSLLLTKY
jgi:signal transduction histidine kinase